jgi:hypothetical protein
MKVVLRGGGRSVGVVRSRTQATELISSEKNCSDESRILCYTMPCTPFKTNRRFGSKNKTNKNCT